MSYCCPKCGNRKYFTAYSVVLYGKTLITPEGWNWFDCGQDAELAPEAIMRCEECGYEAKHYEFEEEAMSEKKVEYIVECGTFLELSNGTRRFGDSPFGDVLDDFEDAYRFYDDIDVEEEYELMSKSRLFGGRSVYKRLDRVEYRNDNTSVVDVIMFEYFDGEEVMR